MQFSVENHPFNSGKLQQLWKSKPTSISPENITWFISFLSEFNTTYINWKGGDIEPSAKFSIKRKKVKRDQAPLILTDELLKAVKQNSAHPQELIVLAILHLYKFVDIIEKFKPGQSISIDPKNLINLLDLFLILSRSTFNKLLLYSYGFLDALITSIEKMSIIFNNFCLNFQQESFSEELFFIIKNYFEKITEIFKLFSHGSLWVPMKKRKKQQTAVRLFDYDWIVEYEAFKYLFNFLESLLKLSKSVFLKDEQYIFIHLILKFFIKMVTETSINKRMGIGINLLCSFLDKPYENTLSEERIELEFETRILTLQLIKILIFQRPNIEIEFSKSIDISKICDFILWCSFEFAPNEHKLKVENLKIEFKKINEKRLLTNMSTHIEQTIPRLSHIHKPNPHSIENFLELPYAVGVEAIVRGDESKMTLSSIKSHSGIQSSSKYKKLFNLLVEICKESANNQKLEESHSTTESSQQLFSSGEHIINLDKQISCIILDTFKFDFHKSFENTFYRNFIRSVYPSIQLDVLDFFYSVISEGESSNLLDYLRNSNMWDVLLSDFFYPEINEEFFNEENVMAELWDLKKALIQFIEFLSTSVGSNSTDVNALLNLLKGHGDILGVNSDVLQLLRSLINHKHSTIVHLYHGISTISSMISNFHLLQHSILETGLTELPFSPEDFFQIRYDSFALLDHLCGRIDLLVKDERLIMTLMSMVLDNNTIGYSLHKISLFLNFPNITDEWSTLFEGIVDRLAQIRREMASEKAFSIFQTIRNSIVQNRRPLQQRFADAGIFSVVVAYLEQEYSPPILDILRELFFENRENMSIFDKQIGFESLGQKLLAISGEKKIEIYNHLLRLLIKSGDFHTTKNKLIHNPHITKTLIRFTFENSELLTEFEEILLDMVKSSVHNISSCGEAGLVSLLATLIPSIEGKSQDLAIKLLGIIGSHAMTVAELKSLFLLARHKENIQLLPHLLQALQVMKQKDRSGPSVFFDLSSEYAAIVIPEINTWPSKGYSFCTWLRVETFSDPIDAIGPVAEYSPRIVSFIGDGGNALEIFFEIDPQQEPHIVIRTVIKGRIEQLSLPFLIKEQEWFYLSITHGQTTLRNKEARIFINGILIGKGNLPMPQINGAKKNKIGSSFRIDGLYCLLREQPLQGQLGTLYFIDDTLTTTQIQQVYSFGPNYMGDMGVADSIFMNYNCKASNGDHCFDQSLGERTDALLQNIFTTDSRDIEDIINCIGGIKVMFPLIPLTEGHPELLESVFSLLAHFLITSEVNQAEMYRLNGFQVIGYLIRKLSPDSIPLSIVESIKEIILHVKDFLLESMINDFILCYENWIYTSIEIQTSIIELIKMICSPDFYQKRLSSSHLGRKRTSSFKRKESISRRRIGSVYKRPQIKFKLLNVSDLMDILQFWLWLEPEDTSLADMPYIDEDGEVLGDRPDYEDIKSLRSLLLSTIDTIVQTHHPREYISSMILYCLFTEVPEHLHDVLRSIYELVQLNPPHLVENLINTFDPFIQILNFEDYLIRQLSLRIIGVISELVGKQRYTPWLDAQYFPVMHEFLIKNLDRRAADALCDLMEERGTHRLTRPWIVKTLWSSRNSIDRIHNLILGNEKFLQQNGWRWWILEELNLEKLQKNNEKFVNKPYGAQEEIIDESGDVMFFMKADTSINDPLFSIFRHFHLSDIIQNDSLKELTQTIATISYFGINPNNTDFDGDGIIRLLIHDLMENIPDLQTLQQPNNHDITIQICYIATISIIYKFIPINQSDQTPINSDSEINRTLIRFFQREISLSLVSKNDLTVSSKWIDLQMFLDVCKTLNNIDYWNLDIEKNRILNSNLMVLITVYLCHDCNQEVTNYFLNLIRNPIIGTNKYKIPLITSLALLFKEIYKEIQIQKQQRELDKSQKSLMLGDLARQLLLIGYSVFQPILINPENQPLLPRDKRQNSIESMSRSAFLFLLDKQEWKYSVEIYTFPHLKSFEWDFNEKLWKKANSNALNSMMGNPYMKSGASDEEDIITYKKELIQRNNEQINSHKVYCTEYLTSIERSPAERLWRTCERSIESEQFTEQKWHWKLDRAEDSKRRRMRLRRNYNFDDHIEASRRRDEGRKAETQYKIGTKQVEDKQEMDTEVGKIVMRVECTQISPLLELPGTLELTTENLRFIPSEEDSDVKIYKWPLDTIVSIQKRLYLLQPTALEIFLLDRSNMMFNFTQRLRERTFRKIHSLNPPNLSKQESQTKALKKYQKKWINREISNFEYLIRLNSIAGRTYNDLAQYPVFPWILNDYTSEILDINNPEIYRDLSKPIGVLGEDRKVFFQKRWRMQEEMAKMGGPAEPSYHFGTHYSSSAITLFYLIRLEPFTTLSIKLQGGKFDHGDRLFNSIPETWSNCMKNTSDVKELIPEFFYLPEFLENAEGFDLGQFQDGRKINHVELPKWADNPDDFIRKHRDALESDYVSSHLNDWIDLIFGFKQNGPEAIEAINVFYYTSYCGAVDLESVEDDVKREALMSQIINFGQTPLQLFQKPHPKRKTISSLSIYPSTLKMYFSAKVNPILSTILCDSESTLTILSLDKQRKIAKRKYFEGTLDEPRKMERVNISFSPLVSLTNLFSSAIGDRLLSVGYWDNSIKVLDQDGVVDSSIYHKEVVSAVARDQDTIVSGSFDTTVVIWKMDSKASTISPKQVLYGHTDKVLSIDIDLDIGIVASGSKSGDIFIHTVTNGRIVRRINVGSAVKLLKILKNGLMIIYTNSIIIYTINGRLIKSTTPQEPVTAWDNTPDGRYIIIGFEHGSVQVWDTYSLQPVRSFRVGDTSVLVVELSFKYLLIVLDDGRLAVFTTDEFQST